MACASAPNLFQACARRSELLQIEWWYAMPRTNRPRLKVEDSSADQGKEVGFGILPVTPQSTQKCSWFRRLWLDAGQLQRAKATASGRQDGAAAGDLLAVASTSTRSCRFTSDKAKVLGAIERIQQQALLRSAYLRSSSRPCGKRANTVSCSGSRFDIRTRDHREKRPGGRLRVVNQWRGCLETDHSNASPGFGCRNANRIRPSQSLRAGSYQCRRPKRL